MTTRDTERSEMKVLLTVAEAAEALSLGKSRVYEEIAAGQLHTVKIGRARRVPVSELEAYVRRLAERIDE